MAFSIRPNAKTSTAEKFITDIFLKKDVFHLFFGKVDPWGNSDDTPPTSSVVTEKSDREIRGDILYLKRILPNEVSIATKRYDWESGVVYTQWDDAINMDNEPFYVMTAAYRVYKCLCNNVGSPSTIEPSGTQQTPLRTSDGYIWKYMYSVPVTKRKRFVSVDRIPVQKAFSDSFYNKGAIDSVSIDNVGSGYTNSSPTSITVGSGTTVGSGASLKVASVDGSGAITSCTVVNGGSAYISVGLTVTSASGHGAVLNATIVGGVITAINIDEAGTGYAVNDVINAVVGGATMLPIVVNGAIESVLITNPGYGYTVAPTLAVAAGGATVSGKYSPNTTALLSAIILNGSIDRVLISDPGVGYIANTDTTISINGDGVGAVLVPVVSDGELVDVFVADPGVGYTSAELTVEHVSGTGAVITPIIGNNDLDSDQSIVEQAAIDGGIHLIVVESPGTGYTETTTVEITGDGEDAEAVATVSNGNITKIEVTNWGYGYTYASVVVSDPNRLDPELQDDVVARVVISPDGGHGKNAPNELLASTAVVSLVVRDIPELKTINQDFRQYGMIRNLRDVNSGSRVTALSSYEAIVTEFASTVGLVKDSIVENTFARYKVVYISDTTVHLLPLGKRAVSPLGNLSLVTTDQTPMIWNCSAVLTTPTIDKYSGDLYFIGDEVPFYVDPVQGIIIRSFIDF